MEGLLIRHTFDPDWSLGTLYLDGRFQCFMLEDPARLGLGFKKIPGVTAIPTGTYPVAITWSNKFERLLPLIQDVPGYTGVRIHPGNWPRQTEGCLLPGLGISKGRTVSSGLAFTPVYNAIRKAEREGGFTLTIVSAWNQGAEMVCGSAWAKEGERAVVQDT
ncbi:MAG TPA: DUF5675 family protein [Thermoleophilia bacterium]|nr:DUF5675 family protein [Thermoleophilia bacterium]